jgi:hypothetical protein
MSVMTEQLHTHHDRSEVAQAAWAELPHGGRDAIRLQVQCGHSHHIAAVYATPAGLVYMSTVRPRSHGDYDLPDSPHDQQPHHWFDLLEVEHPDVDDALPAWCDCGHRSLSRVAVLDWIGSGEHRVVID